ncbi:phage tail assembly protein [Desulfuromonas acetoxidans]|uniref:phage tail assembly protein n=1 Tax=Desulfuromonas acetoxidans TaxID=891 RepID=UPI0029302AAC|nr:phage tail assembly protein [Desulfuromonas acetoxidans]
MKKIILKYPVTVDGQEHQAITIRRPRVKDQLAVTKMKASEAQQEVCLFANLTEVSPAVIEELDLIDYQSLQDTYRGFLTPDQETSSE